MKPEYPSWSPERREAARQLYIARIGIEEFRRRKREYYHKNREKILCRQRERYFTEPEYREKMQQHSREFYQLPENVERGILLRKKQYWKDPEKYRKYALSHRASKRQEYLQREAVRREKNRERTRAEARWNSLNLTNRYIREQLSKYSNKSMHEWTPEEVEAKREQILNSRIKRLTPTKVAEIRRLYTEDENSTLHGLASHYGISLSSVCSVLKNRWHFDPDYTPPSKNSKVYWRLTNEAAQLLKFLNGEKNIE